ncbi:hemophore-related protein [Brevibacillus laterosporus]|uniref:hemophore-related protein n=1 Tax=Brevibacillus laterosporus TaxID=1465 RepID=UPI00264F96BF|nr:hemophore-related protein [Brevibacillus laterosporus]MDN9009058.1 hemophore-related protein [Brevibacillus laterosporus]MDO0942511.1 hemophore-related protein [Brevibacillus laterosporus]
MLNGKKSYLISFTALFSKKGYELAFGIDTVFNGTRNTKYHVTAPVNSTYRSLKLDTYTTANKVSNSATGLLGKNIKLASNVTEVEGVEAELAFGNVVSYFLDIYKYSNGEYAGKECNHHDLYQGTPFLNVQEQIDRTTKADSILHANHERTVLSETLVPVCQSSFIYGSPSLEVQNQHAFRAVGYDQHAQTDATSSADKILNTYKATVESQDFASTPKKVDASHPNQLTNSKRKTPTYESEEMLLHQNILYEKEGELQKKYLTSKMDYGLENQGSKAAVRIHGEMLDAKGEQNALGYRKSIYDADTLHDVPDPARRASYLADCTDKKAAKPVFDKKEQIVIETLLHLSRKENKDIYSISSFSASDSLSIQADAKLPQKVINGLASENVPGHVLDFIQSHVKRDGGGTLDKLSVSNLGIDKGVDQQTFHAVEGLKSILAQNPEISKMSRLLEIMHGVQAFKMIEAGMENVIRHTVMQATSDVDIHSVSQSVIQHLMKGNSSQYSEAGMQKFTQCLAAYTKDVQIEREDLGQNQIKANGLEDKQMDASVSTRGVEATASCFVSKEHSKANQLANTTKFLLGQSARTQYSDESGSIVHGLMNNYLPLNVDDAVFVTKSQNRRIDLEELISSNRGFVRELDRHHQFLLAEVEKDPASDTPLNYTKANFISDTAGENALWLVTGNKNHVEEALMLEKTCGPDINSGSEAITDDGIHAYAELEKSAKGFSGYTEDTQQEFILWVDKRIDRESEYQPQLTAHTTTGGDAVVEEGERTREGTDFPFAMLENKGLGTKAVYADGILDFTKLSERENTDNGVFVFLTEAASSLAEDSSRVDSTETADYLTNYKTSAKRPETANRVTSYEASEQHPETADYVTDYESLDQHPETAAAYVTNYEALDQHPETAAYVTNYEALDQHPETADYVTDYESLDQKLETAAYVTNYEALDQHPETAAAYVTNYEALDQQSETAAYVTNYEALDQHPETAAYVTNYEALDQHPETAAYVTNYEALDQHPETAAYATNYEALDQHPETAAYVTNYEALDQHPETAAYATNYEALDQHPETAAYVTNYEALDQHPETAAYVKNYESSEQQPETADYVIDYNNLSVDKLESGAYDLNYDAETSNMESGVYKEKILNTYTSVNNMASVQKSTDESSFVEWNSGNRQQLTIDAISSGLESGENNKLDNVNLHNGELASSDKGLTTVIEEMTMQVGDSIYDARMETAESSGADTISISVTQKLEESYMNGSNKLGVLHRQVHATTDGGSTQTTVTQETKADSITMTQDSHVHIHSDSVRKKKRVVTHLQIEEVSGRRKRVYPTLLFYALKGKRKKNVMITDLIQPEEARRPNKKINTVLEHGSRATNETIPTSPKRKIWMILGKIASWSIWNWKKTR